MGEYIVFIIRPQKSLKSTKHDNICIAYTTQTFSGMFAVFSISALGEALSQNIVRIGAHQGTSGDGQLGEVIVICGVTQSGSTVSKGGLESVGVRVINDDSAIREAFCKEDINCHYC